LLKLKIKLPNLQIKPKYLQKRSSKLKISTHQIFKLKVFNPEIKIKE
jgi:hypothetical protein